MEKYKILIIGFMALIASYSCSSDDASDNSRETAFFPSKINVSAGGDAEEATIRYNEENQLVGITTTNSSSYEYSYQDDGLINQILNTNNGNSYEIEYDGTLISNITRVSDGGNIPVSYADGRYDLEGGFAIFNNQNQLIQRNDINIEYSDLAGPFQVLDFQPILYLDDFDFLFVNYILSKNEIIQLRADIGTFTFTSERDENNNIVDARAVDESGNERFVFTIEYEQKTIIN
ncbi:hypothetical protein [Aquimarina celericrescens]|uniref:YD repeat-containing protein n=1 Tax=Aquimarina celericrescens TaxID=1964542 RepID=A0ABW5ASE7_9FLAO|nr:hypothetical protein [Aquimarina celericrescens]